MKKKFKDNYFFDLYKVRKGDQITLSVIPGHGKRCATSLNLPQSSQHDHTGKLEVKLGSGVNLHGNTLHCTSILFGKTPGTEMFSVTYELKGGLEDWKIILEKKPKRKAVRMTFNFDVLFKQVDG